MSQACQIAYPQDINEFKNYLPYWHYMAFHADPWEKCPFDDIRVAAIKSFRGRPISPRQVQEKMPWKQAAARANKGRV